jgi:hypothetical protein
MPDAQDEHDEPFVLELVRPRRHSERDVVYPSALVRFATWMALTVP